VRNTRPKNETELDIKRQVAVVSTFVTQICNRELIAVTLQPALYDGIDYALFNTHDNSLHSYAEIKTATYPLNKFGHAILSHAKYTHLRVLSQAAKVPGLLILGDTTGLHVHTLLPPGSYPIKLTGNNRGQIGDKEPCIYIEETMFDHYPTTNPMPWQ
jgi:hypothetical protein